MTKNMEAIAIVGALAGGVVLGWLLRKADDSMKIKLLTRQRDDAQKENVGRLTSVYWQGVRNARMQAAARIRVRGSAVGEEASVVELAEWAEARGRGDVA